VIVAYDITNLESFNNIQKWLQEGRRYTCEDVPCMIVGNKADLHRERKVSTEDGRNLADSLKLGFLETSAKKGTNVEEAFSRLAALIVQQLEEKKPERGDF
jgi:small GTP-binding protein